MGIGPFISVVIPNRNGKDTISKCLDAVFLSDYKGFEVIVVDDCSTDGSVEIIKRYPAKLIRLPVHSGASRARNEGARRAEGDAVFFIDSDCVMKHDTLTRAAAAFREDAVVGGTYTPLPFDRRFFSDFQSIFINHFETRKKKPDYIATHAMLITKKLFLESGGFNENFLPIIEDVEFSHRLRKKGIGLAMDPELQVRHIFDFSLTKSLKNAFKKSLYWTIYSIRNKDLLRDSGTASIGLKINTLSWAACAALLTLYFYRGKAVLASSAISALMLNLFLNRDFLKAMHRASGLPFAIGAALYYTMLYPVAVAAGGLSGLLGAAISLKKGPK
jgi:GT2 family glycosyltransferase